MADVAARAGVSAQTVSRALRGHPYVTVDKRTAFSRPRRRSASA